MTLSALIRKRDHGELANDNPANPAKDGQGKAGTLSTLAGLALANPTSPKTATAWRWLLHYPEGTQEIRFLPEVTRAQALASCPGSIDAEPLAEGRP